MVLVHQYKFFPKCFSFSPWKHWWKQYLGYFSDKVVYHLYPIYSYDKKVFHYLGKYDLENSESYP